VSSTLEERARAEGGIKGEVWISLDSQGIAVGIFGSREWCEEDARIYGDGAWQVTGPYVLAAPAPPGLEERALTFYEEHFDTLHSGRTVDALAALLRDVAAEARAEEREACARECEAFAPTLRPWPALDALAARIRARGQR
jgi:hypothetical protein